MPFEKGNKLGGSPKLFAAALKRAIAQDNGARIRQCAETLLDLAAAGEPWAVRELIDRLDGKAAQSIEVQTAHSAEDMTLEQLTAALAAATAGRGAEADSGAGESDALH